MSLPDVEAMAVAFLRAEVGGHVGTRVPNPRPGRFVQVVRTGGAAVNRVLDAANVTVTAWGETTTDASELATECRTALLERYTGMTLVRGATETGGLYSNPDPASGVPRYTFTVRLMVRAHRN